MRQAAHRATRRCASTCRRASSAANPARLRTLGDPAQQRRPRTRADRIGVQRRQRRGGTSRSCAGRRPARRRPTSGWRSASALLGWSKGRSSDVARTLEGIASDAPSSDAFPLVERGLVSLWQGCTARRQQLVRAGQGGGPRRLLRRARGQPPAPQPEPVVPAVLLLPAAAGRLARRAPAGRGRASRLGQARAGVRSGACRTPGGEPTHAPRRSRPSQRIRRRSTRRSPRSCSATTRIQPAVAVGGLGMLIKNNPQAASPVLHLGLLLLWIKRTALARQEFAKAVKLDPIRPNREGGQRISRKPERTGGLTRGSHCKIILSGCHDCSRSSSL